MVNTGLHQHIGEADDHILYAGGQPHADNAPSHIAVQAQAFHADSIIGLYPQQVAYCQQAGDQLAHIGSHSGTGYAHFAPLNKHQVQYNVGHGGGAQVQQRAAGIAGSVENTGGHIVHHIKEKTAGVNAQVQHRVVQYSGWGVHGHQQHPA